MKVQRNLTMLRMYVCVNTSTRVEHQTPINLLCISVGSTIDSLQQKYKLKFGILFDDAAAYIFKDVSVHPHPRKRGRFTMNNSIPSSDQRHTHILGW